MYKKMLVLGVSFFVSLLLFWLLFLNHVGVNEVGVAYNSWNGEITVQKRAGWHITSPLVKVVTISTLPMRVELPTSAKVINAKIVRFKPEGAIEFVKMQGFSYLLDDHLPWTLMGYAFSNREQPFLEIMEEIRSSEVK